MIKNRSQRVFIAKGSVSLTAEGKNPKPTAKQFLFEDLKRFLGIFFFLKLKIWSRKTGQRFRHTRSEAMLAVMEGESSCAVSQNEKTHPGS